MDEQALRQLSGEILTEIKEWRRSRQKDPLLPLRKISEKLPGQRCENG
jgi:hypothetical protein